MTAYSQHRFHVLDGMRGIAAILVMFYHYNFNMEPHAPWLSNGFLAVDFFFMLSGFVIFYAYGEKLRNGLAVRDYAARRIGRLYPLAAIGLLVGVLNIYSLYIGAPVSDFTEASIVSAFANNFLLLPYLSDQAKEIKIFPFNTALWSIPFEIVVSLGFLFLSRLREQSLRFFCVGCLSLLAMSALFHGLTDHHKRLLDMDMGWCAGNFLGGFPRAFYAFSVGMLIYMWRFTPDSLPRVLEKIKFAINPWLLYGLLVFVLALPLRVQGLYDLFTIAVLAPLLIWFGSLATCRDGFTAKISQFLGWISFPLYCVHQPLFEGARMLEGQPGYADSVGIPARYLAILASLILAMLSGLIVDRLKLQQRIANGLNRGFAAFAK